MKHHNKLIVALDFENKYKALQSVDHLRSDVKLFKVGLELFSACGPEIVADIIEKGCGVFLDLKFHDIPNTVEKAARAVSGLGALIFNVHALGGLEMMKRAKGAAGDRSKVIAVTILTSTDENALKKCGINVNIEDEVINLAALAKEAGLDGVVASAKEAARIRKELGKDFLIVVPGIRPVSAATDDQKRVATPLEAIAAGADYIVVGRPITAAPDPAQAARNILKELG
ncbi:MAG: orotidine-5'-phosphate decarboxylase [Candidatus Omnitrophica bacterium]|nr:orotidine-5'-phosphate decarboxylase [Candidatus Omnitrophota bacterium]